MPDRRLTVNELSSKFDALETHCKEGVRPSLHDLCIVELKGKINGLTAIVVEQGKIIKTLEKKLQKKG